MTDNKDILKCVEILKEENLTCVLVKDELVFKSSERGVKPLLNLIESECSFVGYSVADKVVGKAAAFLYVILGVKEVYALTVSDLAIDVFGRYGIALSYENRVGAIRNRTDTGLCPMESAVREISAPDEALTAIKKKLRELQNN